MNLIALNTILSTIQCLPLLCIACYHLSLQTVIILLSVVPQPTIGQVSVAIKMMAEVSSTTGVAMILAQTIAGVILGLAPQVVKAAIGLREVVLLAQDIVSV
jgi:hypothetical protein